MSAQTALASLSQLMWIKILIASLIIPVLLMAVIMSLEYWQSGYGTGDSRKFVRKAVALLSAGKFGELNALSQQRLQEKPNDASGHYYSAMASYRLGKFAEAETAFRAFLDMDPGMQERIQPFLDRCQSEAGKSSKPEP